MKKLLLLFVSVFFATFALSACGGDTNSTTDNDNQNANDETNAEKTTDETKTLGIGDTVDIDGVKFTLKNVTTTDERNEFADTQPPIVIKIEYEIENLTDQEIPIGGDLEVYDATGNKMESYPLDNTLGSIQPGKKMQCVEHYGIEQGPIEIYFQPMFSFEDPAVFKVDIQ